MTRSVSTAVQEALTSSNVPMLVLVELNFSSGTLYACNAPYPFVWNGNTYLGLGLLGGIGPVNEGASLEADGIALKLSGVPLDGEGESENIAIALAEHYQGRSCKVYAAPLATDAYLDLPGSLGNYASTPDSAAVSITGDIDIRFKIAPNDWSPVSAGRVISKWRSSQSWLIFLNTDASFSFYMSSNGSNQFNIGLGPPTGTVDGSPKFCRITRVLSTGLTSFLQSTDGITWTLINSGVLQAGVAMFDSSDPIEVGSDVDFQSLPAKFYYADVRSVIDGPVVADFDASLPNLSANGTVWTIHKSGANHARLVRNPYAMLVDPVLLFSGRMDTMAIQLGKTATIVVTAESRFADLERPRVRRYNDADQQAEYPGDLGLEFVEQMVSKVIRWGR